MIELVLHSEDKVMSYHTYVIVYIRSIIIIVIMCVGWLDIHNFRLGLGLCIKFLHR